MKNFLKFLFFVITLFFTYLSTKVFSDMIEEIDNCKDRIEKLEIQNSFITK